MKKKLRFSNFIWTVTVRKFNNSLLARAFFIPRGIEARVSRGDSWGTVPTPDLGAATAVFIAILLFASPASASFSFLNDQLEVGARERYRMEYRSDFNFNGSSDAFHLTRLRLNFDYNPHEDIRFFIQAQDARLYESDFSGPAENNFQDRFDLRQGYAELKNIFDTPVRLLVGRQELSYGEQRLIGGFNWSNVAQTFDVLRAIYETEEVRIDLFSSERVLIEDDHFNERDHNDHFHGLYATWKKIKKHLIDFYVLFRDTEKARAFSRAESAAKMDEVTLGTRIKGWGQNGWDYQLEIAGQGGNYGNEEIQAFALIAQLGYTFAGCPTTPHFFIEYAHASGDDDPGDGDRETFDNLFPTNHGFYGYADFVSLQNINDIELGIDLKPFEKLKMICSLHLFFLDEEEDALYNAGRRPIRFDPTGKASTTVGQEIDLVAKYTVTDFCWAEVGYSHFFTDGFIEDTGASHDPDFLYTQVKLAF